MIREKLIEYTNAGNKTLLGVGPMSVNIVDVTIELAKQHNAPLMLIAGSFMNAYIFGELCVIVENINKKGQAFQEKMDLTTTTMKNIGLN